MSRSNDPDHFNHYDRSPKATKPSVRYRMGFLKQTRDVLQKNEMKAMAQSEAIDPVRVPYLSNEELFMSYNNCFNKTPRMHIKHGFIDKCPIEAPKISSYRGDLTRFATAVSNANFVKKHGIADYFKLMARNKQSKDSQECNSARLSF